jgi:predicted SAM-dependent methyltransferase
LSRLVHKVQKRIRRASPDWLAAAWELVSVPLIHANGVRKARRLLGRNDLKIQLGCGARIKPGWINIDLRSSADIRLDLSRKLPFASSSTCLIYSEHFLEHIEYPGPAMSLLRECHRMLTPGGIFSVGVPDTEWPLLEYAGVRHDGYFDQAKKSWHPDWCETALEHINFHFRQGREHRFAYDFSTLKKALERAGFVNVRRRDFDPELDSEERRLGTLYVNAYKAGP